MVKVKMYRKIQNLKRQGFSQQMTAQKLEVNPRTVAKYFSMDEEEYRIYRSKCMFREKVLIKYEGDILDVYKQNEFKKLNMSALYDYLEEKNGPLPCNEQTLRNYISYLLQAGKLKLNEKLRSYSKVPELPFGRQMQLDFGQYRCPSGLKLYIFVAVLSASRYKYVVFQDHPFKTIEVIHHLLDCFNYFGGIPQEIVIDQDKLMVVSENFGDIIYTGDFQYFIEELKVQIYVCRKNDPETKGKVENTVKYVKYNFLNIRNFKSLEEANKSLFEWLSRRANGKISQATRQIPSILMEVERSKLRPIANSIFNKDSLIGREERNVTDKACISINASVYQLPVRYKSQTVEVYITKQKVFVFDQCTGREIVNYDLSLLPGKLISKREYKREKEKALDNLKANVLNLFTGKSWEQFVYKNFKAFPRYARDQCIEAKRYFHGETINSLVMNQALEYCLENNTPSFLNLFDTYNYFKRDNERQSAIIPESSKSSIKRNYSDFNRQLSVSSRALTVYEDLINNMGRENNESL
jgi:transposase